MTNDQKELLERIEKETGLDALYIAEELPEDVDGFIEELMERVGEIEVIYYTNAMEYLSENDPSLNESLELAHDAGFSLSGLNSETLATLLKQQNASEALEGFRNEIEEVFYSEVAEQSKDDTEQDAFAVGLQ